MKRTVILILLVTSFISSSYGQELQKRIYSAIKFDKTPVIDGRLDDEVWGSGIWEGNFTQLEPYEGKSPSQATEFKVAFDNNNIYVAIKAFDTSPDSIVDRLTRRDDIDGDNVGIFFDSYHDLRTAFAFFISSAGVKNDMLYSNDGQSQDMTWDPIWYAAASRFSGGWTAEMRIPLTQLRFKSNAVGNWGVEVAREIYRYKEVSLWQAIPKSAPGFVHLFGELEGIDNLKPLKQADITPYAVGSFKNYQRVAGNPFAPGKDFSGSAGVDGKFGVTNNLTLDFTILPDFGQVEADPSEVNLTAYETYFREQRPFFIEGRNITSFRVGIGDGDLSNDNLFYSRRIGRQPQISPSLDDGECSYIPRSTRILGAAKITGKTQEGLSIGMLNAVTAEEKAEIDLNGERRLKTVEPLTNYFVTRIQKDFDRGKTIIGGVFTNTLRKLEGTGITSLHRTAYSSGLDFTRYFSDKNWLLSATVAVSNVQGTQEAISATQRSSVHYFQRPDAGYVKYDPERTSLSGHAGNVQFGKVGGNWNFVYFTIWKSPGFETNDLGYTRKSDEFGQLIWSSYSINKPFSVFRRIRFNFNEYQFWDFGGNFLSWGGNFSIYTQFKNQWSTNIGYNGSGTSVSNTLLRGGPSMKLPGYKGMSLSLSSDSRKSLMFSSYGSIRLGSDGYSDNKSINMGLTYRPLNTLAITATPAYSISYNELQYVAKRTFENNDRYIFGSLKQKILSLSLRINYNITPDFSIQYWGQPFLAAVDFNEYKLITDSKAGRYNDRFRRYTEAEISYNGEENIYDIDENNDGQTDYSFSNPDMNSDAFLSNLVVRWEFKPGSTLFLVWSQNRDYYEPDGGFAVWNNVNNLFTDKKPTDVFLVKFSYRFGLR